MVRLGCNKKNSYIQLLRYISVKHPQLLSWKKTLICNIGVPLKSVTNFDCFLDTSVKVSRREKCGYDRCIIEIFPAIVGAMMGFNKTSSFRASIVGGLVEVVDGVDGPQEHLSLYRQPAPIFVCICVCVFVLSLTVICICIFVFVLERGVGCWC